MESTKIVNPKETRMAYGLPTSPEQKARQTTLFALSTWVPLIVAVVVSQPGQTF